MLTTYIAESDPVVIVEDEDGRTWSLSPHEARDLAADLIFDAAAAELREHNEFRDRAAAWLPSVED